MEPAVEPFAGRVAEVDLEAPRLPFVSSATGTWIEATEVRDPAYWASQLRRTVRFADGVEAVLERWPAPILLEVGPGVALSRMVRQDLMIRRSAGEPAEDPKPTVVASMRPPRQDGSDVATLQEALGQLWLAGRTIHWESVHQAHRRRLALPTYPFARRRLWIEAEEPREAGLRAGRTPDRWLFAPSWKRSRAPRRFVDEGAKAPWLVFSDGGQLAEAVLHRLAEEERLVTVALADDTFQSLGDGTYTLRPDSETDYDALLEAFGEMPPAGVVHLWTLSASQNGRSGGDGLTAGWRLGGESLLRLGRSWARRGFEVETRWIAISNGLCDVLGDEDGAPAFAGLAAACRSLSEIYPGVTCRQVDLDLPTNLEHLRGSRQVEQILAEASIDGEELCVAYRGAHRWIPGAEALVPGDVTPTTESQASPVAGTWLVQGGLKEPGFGLARSLAASADTQIVLLEPEALPARPTWSEWLTDRGAPTPEELAASLVEEGVVAPLAEALTISDEIPARARRGLQQQARETLPVDFEPAVDALCAAYVHRLFAERIDVTAGTRYSLDELRKRFEIAPEGERFFAYLLRLLAEDGLLDLGDESVTFQALPGQLADPERLRQRLEGRFPAFAAGFECLAYCTAHTLQVLSGELDPVGVLYPGGDSRMLGDVMAAQARYSTSQVYQQVIAELLADLAAESTSRPLRILELQAGDGDLTWQLAEALRDQNAELWVTDPGRSFVLNARRQAAQRGLESVVCRVLDLNGELEPQGFAPHQFDVVVAADAVHTTERVRSTLRWIEHLLAPGGVALLLEPTRRQRWVTLIWGLLQDWWRFTDFELRRDSPILEPAAFEQVLADLDLAESAVFPRGTEARATADHSLLFLRQPVQPRTPETLAWAEARWQRRRRHLGERLRKVLELEGLGADVSWRVADPANSKQMATALNASSIGQLRGVIVASTVDEPEASASERMHRDLDPTVTAAALARAGSFVEGLETALAGRAPEHALLVTDVAAAAGEAGQGGSSAVDAFFARRAAGESGHGRSGRTISWRSVVWGLAAIEAPDRGAAALAQVLAQDAPRLAITRQPDGDLAIGWNRARPRTAVNVGDLSLSASESAAEVGAIAPRNVDERTVAAIWREVLGVEHLDVRDTFFDLGGDSLIATQLHSRLREAFGLELPMAKLFEEPTIEAQARALDELRQQQENKRHERLLAQLAEMSDEEAEAELARMLGGNTQRESAPVEIET